MLQSLKNIFSQTEKSDDNISDNEQLNILCGLMIEAANTDGNIDKMELDNISTTLVEVFDEQFPAVKEAIEKCLKDINEPKSLHYFTSKINKIFSDEKKILLIETLWQIILSDGEIHDYESNLIRRLAGLLYITDVACGNAKKRALSKLNL